MTQREDRAHASGLWLLILLLIVLSLYDLLLPNFTAPTILRQAQTAMQTENFLREGFSISGLYLNIFGNEKPVMALEFPIYNFFVALFFKLFGPGIVWGKLVSLLSSLGALVCLNRMVRQHYDDRVAFWSGLFFILSPVGMMMRTAFQPDAFALLGVLLALAALLRWREQQTLPSLAMGCLLLLASGLAKYPVMIPFLPLLALCFFSRNARFYRPRLVELALVVILFLVPFLSWYLYRGTITDAKFGLQAIERSTFLIGDLSRFFHITNYIIPGYSIVVLLCSGIGFFLLAAGVRHMSMAETALLSGIPCYFIMIPTVMYQHYYLFPCVVITALFMAKGWLRLTAWCAGRQAAVVKNLVFVLFTLSFGLLSLYVVALRNDRVMVDAAQAIKRLTGPDELVFSATMHNRTAIFGGVNPTFFYLAGRRGWNADLGRYGEPHGNIAARIDRQVAERRAEGAQWLIITWYSPDVESPVDAYLPASAKTGVDPGIDGRIVFDELNKKYQTVLQTRNYAVLKL